MRTTVDLPDEVHQLARELAQQQSSTISRVLARLVADSLAPVPEPGRGVRGMPTIAVGRVVTAEDVRSLDDAP